MLRGNQEARFKACAVALQWGWLSVNDIRSLESLPPVTGGDVYLQPLNMVVAGTQMPEKLTDASDEQVRDIQKAMI